MAEACLYFFDGKSYIIYIVLIHRVTFSLSASLIPSPWKHTFSRNITSMVEVTKECQSDIQQQPSQSVHKFAIRTKKPVYQTALVLICRQVLSVVMGRKRWLTSLCAFGFPPLNSKSWYDKRNNVSKLKRMITTQVRTWNNLSKDNMSISGKMGHTTEF